MPQSIRLQKYISDCGIMSRRSAEEAIVSGEIAVNGASAVLGTKIIPGKDIVTYRGREIRMPRNAKKVYIMLNKPAGYVTTLSDEKDRKCITSLIADVPCRVYPCGRLDMDSDGLLLLTNDGDLANKLTHPGHSIPKIYYVRVDGEITLEQLETLNMPMEIDGYTIRPVLTELITRKDGRSSLRMTLYEGRNRQIRKMCASVGLDVLRLRRIAIGAIRLGDLKPGKWKYLTHEQIDYLRSVN